MLKLVPIPADFVPEMSLHSDQVFSGNTYEKQI